ncbi:hypothetical protein DBV14_09500 [Variovorax sp. KBW07]|uniref:hypothetical protein n=1 Tax=Variovorax sp. KBW07 TaxID=2153358 RepID=UPI000F57DC1F|nr:hypothetical protein [Variovorax sp. KBW07]RQO57034.1 hypothetical protein DBV14_09500 [Variovorax sp. KBW07]
MYIEHEAYIELDTRWIPRNEDNPDYQRYLEWCAIPGNVPQQAAGPTFEQREAALLAAVDEHLNAAARAKRYDSIGAAALRAGYPGPFHAEGLAFATWMDAVYAQCYQVLAQVQGGQIQEPTAEQLIAMLPVLTLAAR